MTLRKARIAAVIMASSLSAVTYQVSAENIDKAQSIQSKTNAAAAATQKKVDKSANKSLELQSEIEQLKEEIANLTVYRDHLSSLVSSQDEEKQSLSQQIEQIKVTRQGIVPLMYQMLDGLEQIIENDAPIKRDQRLDRLTKLQELMPRADVSDAEKFRRILEAYQIELDYGSKLGVYQGPIQVAGKALEVELLHLGRVSLVARSLNGENFWAWNKSSSQWQTLDSAQRVQLDLAFDVANQSVAPQLLTLPVSLSQQESN